MMCNIDLATFSYYISKNRLELFSNHIFLKRSNLWLSYSYETSCYYYSGDSAEVAIIGLCVDSHGEYEREKIAETIARIDHFDIKSVYEFCDRFAGKYCIFFGGNNGSYIWGDATGSVLINYYYDKSMIAVSNLEEIIGQQFELKKSQKSDKIRLGSASSQPLPDDITMYEEIKILLPNHILNIGKGTVRRIPFNINYIKSKDVDDICENTMRLIYKIIEEYKKYYELKCPITSGYDSRTIASFLVNVCDNLVLYTFKHKEFNDATSDIYIPKELCKALNREYLIIPDLIAPKDMESYISKYAGKNYEKSVTNLAYTFINSFGRTAFVNGDIIDQVGKSLIGHALPTFLATPYFFMCKLHNSYGGTKNVLKNYISKIKKDKEFKSVYDLFAIENRCGRWASQSDIVLCLSGITSLNIFNCKEIISAWMSIPRGLRVKNILHMYYMRNNKPELLEIPFNPGDWSNFLKKNRILFYFATIAKHILESKEK